MTDLTVAPDYNSDHETLTDTEGRPITADYLEQLSSEADAGYDLNLTHARQLDPGDLAAMRTRGRPAPDPRGTVPCRLRADEPRVAPRTTHRCGRPPRPRLHAHPRSNRTMAPPPRQLESEERCLRWHRSSRKPRIRSSASLLAAVSKVNWYSCGSDGV